MTTIGMYIVMYLIGVATGLGIAANLIVTGGSINE